MKVMAIGTLKPLSPEQRKRYLPAEVPATLQLYLDGKMEQFWPRETILRHVAKEPCGQEGRLLSLRTSSLTTLIEATSSGTIIRELTAILLLLLVFTRR